MHKYVPLYSIAFSKLINNINYFLSHELDKDLEYYDSVKLFSLPYAPKAHQIRSIMFNFHIYYWIWENSGLCIVTTQIEKITHFEKRIHWKCVIFQSALPQCMSYLLYTCLNAGRERQSAWWTVITELIKLSPFNP